ncbi:AGE family epimerase/isomerase [Sphingomonas arantia]|uniref:AGE family epimerase/isomerase n=1 Tax=Sphingomonas arantia TaxID=1460676 RepID=A0ABW4U4A0_9SPHN
MTLYSDAFADLRGWLFDAALPFAVDVGVDPVHGGFFERFTPTGEPIGDPRRARVAGRQVYVFAAAERLGWGDRARPMMRHALAFLDRHLVDPDGIVVPTVAPDGTIVKAGFDLYDQAFVLFGLAAAAAAGEDPDGLRDRARTLRDRMVAGWSHPDAGFEEAMPRTLPLKANPHMHMFEAALAWAAIDPDSGWDALADTLAELALARFINPANGSLREYYDGDWRFIDTPEMDVVEPGHQFEWAWLLIRWGTLRNRPDAIAAARRLVDLAEAHGVSTEQHLAVNELTPDLQVRDPLLRLWPQTERIKAHVALAGIARDAVERDRAEAAAAAATRGLLRFFDHPVRGSWWEHLDIDGHPMAEPARLSSLYHIVCAASVLAGDD